MLKLSSRKKILFLLSLLRFKRNLKQIPTKLKRTYDQRVYDRKNRKKGFAKVLPLYVRDKLAREHAYRKLVVPYLLQEAQRLQPGSPDINLKAIPQIFTAGGFNLTLPALCTVLLRLLEHAIYFLICLVTSTALGIAIARMIPEDAWQSWLGILAHKTFGITPGGLGRTIGICAEAIAIIAFDLAITMIHGSFKPFSMKLFFRGFAALTFSCAITIVGVQKTHDLSRETAADMENDYQEKYKKWQEDHSTWKIKQAKLKLESEDAERKLPAARNEYLRLRWGLAGLDLSLWEACESGARTADGACPKPNSGPQTAAANATLKTYNSAMQSAKENLGKNEPDKPVKENHSSEAYDLLFLWAAIAICKLMRLLVIP